MPCGRKRKRWQMSNHKSRKKRKKHIRSERSRFDVMRDERKKGIIYSLLLAAFLLSGLAQNAGAYTFTYHMQDGLDGANTVIPPSVYWPGDCTVYTTLYGTLNSTTEPFSAYSTWYSPDSIQTLFSAASPLYNSTCRNLGTATAAVNASGFYESKTNTTSSATAAMWTKTVYDCEPDANEIFLYDSMKWRNDSYGNFPYSYGVEIKEKCDNTAGYVPMVPEPIEWVQDWIIKGFASNCGGVLNVSREKDTSVFCDAALAGRTFEILRGEAIPFNSGASGYVNFTLANVSLSKFNDVCAGASTADTWIYLWDTVLNTTTYIDRPTMPESYSWHLVPNRDYWILMNQTSSGTAAIPQECNYAYNHTFFNLSVWAYEPDWNCSAWGECIDGSKQRTCNDLNGRVTPLIETTLCVEQIVENATIGFEDYYTVDTTTICKSIWSNELPYLGWAWLPGYTCGYDPLNISTDRPLNWLVYGELYGVNRYYMEMTSEWATEGSRSLKMWTQPPMPFNLNAAGTACENTSFFASPKIYQNISNSSFTVFYNVTFPAANMRLYMDVARCDRPVKQNGDLKTYWLNTSFSYLPQIQTVCPADCYSQSCESTPDGVFSFDIKDRLGNSLINSPYYGSITDVYTHPFQIDLSNIGLVAGENYTIYIGVKPYTTTETNGNCVMFDNLRYDVLAQPFYLSLPNQECKSDCVGNTYYKTKLVNGACFVVKNEYSADCDTEHKAELLAGTDFCEDANNLNRFINVTRSRQIINCPYGCQDAACLTESQVAATPTTATDYYALLISPGFIAALLIMCLMVGITLHAGGQTWPLAPLGVAQFVAVCSFIGLLPAYIWVMETVISIAFIIYFISNGAGG